MSGILFVGFFVASTALIRSALPPRESTGPEALERLSQIDADLLSLGYALTPFAAIAFIWFMAVFRRRLPPQDQFISSVFLAAGTLFLAIYLVAASLAAGPFYLPWTAQAIAAQPEYAAASISVAYGLIFVVASRVEVLIVLSATSAARAHRALPRWLVWFGLVVAAVQIVSFPMFDFAAYLFPAWVLAVSVTLLRANPVTSDAASGRDPAGSS